MKNNAFIVSLFHSLLLEEDINNVPTMMKMIKM